MGFNRGKLEDQRREARILRKPYSFSASGA
jgi:hypothetical protein